MHESFAAANGAQAQLKASQAIAGRPKDVYLGKPPDSIGVTAALELLHNAISANYGLSQNLAASLGILGTGAGETSQGKQLAFADRISMLAQVIQGSNSQLDEILRYLNS